MGLHGRHQIFTDINRITKDNLLLVLNDAFSVHERNVAEIDYLMRYERGEQPLNREKEIRPEINVQAQENHAAEITSFKIGYEFGSPVTFVQRAKVDAKAQNREPPDIGEKKDDIRISLLNEMMFEENKPAKDVQLARNFKICGVGYRMFRAKRNIDGVSVFDMAIPNPMTTFVVYANDAYREPVLGVTYSVTADGRKLIGAYTKESYFSLEIPALGTAGAIREEPNLIGEIPIIEYVNDYDRMGCFERVIPIMDAINITNSDRVNDIAQYVQNILWMHNCQLDKEQRKVIQDGGVIITKSNGDGKEAKIAYVSAPLNQQETQTLVDYQYEQVLQISGTPGREKTSGGNTGSAILLSNGWQLAETQAKAMELVFSEAEKRSLRVVLAIIRMCEDKDLPDVSMRDLRVSDILVKFSRNRTYDLVSRTVSMSNMINMGIDPEKAITVVDIFDDSHQVALDSRERIDEILLNKNKDMNTESSSHTVDVVEGNIKKNDQPSAVPNIEK